MSRFFNSNIILCLLFLSPLCSAIELTWQQWQELQSQNLKSRNLELFLQQLDKSGFESNSAQNIFLASKLIQSFSENDNLTAKQVHQLNKWRRADAQISVQSQSNSQKVEVMVDIGKEAKAALQSIRARTIANELYQKWQDNEFYKEDLITLKGINKKPMFVGFFNRLPSFLQTGFAQWAIEQLQKPEFIATGEYNHVVGHIAIVLKDKEFAELLLIKMPVDQSSYLFLQSMPGAFEENELLELLTLAANRPKMRTQTFNLLAQHFSDNSAVAVLIASSLKNDKAYWQALTVMPAFVKVGNTQAFENVINDLPESKQAQVKMRLQRKEQ